MTDPAHEDMKATARARAVQAWTTEETKDIEMDSRLAEAFADILVSEWEDKLLDETREQHLKALTVILRIREHFKMQPCPDDHVEKKAKRVMDRLAQERKYNSDLIAAGRRNVDTKELFGRTMTVVEAALHFTIKTAMPFINENQALTELRPLLREGLCNLIIPYEKENLEDFSTKWDEYEAWQEGVDEEHILDEFDLALGWFAGQGFSHDQALQAAETAREIERREWDKGKEE